MSKAALFTLRKTLMSNIATNIRSNPPEGKRRRALRLGGLFLLALSLAAGVSGCASGGRVKDTSRTFDTVVIDAGHGGSARGTWSRWAGAEKNAALSVALRLEPKLRAAGLKTVMTRTRDVDVELEKRARISNRQNNAVFVSIHFNEAGARRIRGTETYFKSSPSRSLARHIQNEVSSLPGHSSRGVKSSNFRVLRLNQYPAVLVECGFFSNPTEGARCATPAHQERIAEAIARGILKQRGLR
jgi:N-acetylmuramoyl-L-alanine amidase